MAVESASFISDFITANPPGTDPVGQADEHIRLIKGVLKSTFPSLNAAVSSTPDQLNHSLVPTGGIIMWTGSVAPTGWGLCDGSTYTKADGSGTIVAPDLRDRFVVSIGGGHTLGSTGGASSNTPAITMTNAGTVLTQANLPSFSMTGTVSDPGHTHTISDPGHTHGYTSPLAQTTLTGTVGVSLYTLSTTTSTNSATTGISLANSTTGISVSVPSGGSGTAHTHANTATCASVPTVPPYYALAFIMRL